MDLDRSWILLPRMAKWKTRLARVTYQKGCVVLEEKEPLRVFSRCKALERMKGMASERR